MTLVLAILQSVGQILAALFLLAILGFIAFVCLLVWLCSIFRPNGYSQRYRDVAGRAKAERKRTIITSHDCEDPRIVGDVSAARWQQASFPRSRANMRRRGE